MTEAARSTRTTAIEWTDHTWNPFVGCSIHTAGCTNCYAMRAALRLQDKLKQPSYAGVAKLANGSPVWTGKINRASDTQLGKPFKVKKPSLFFVNSMSDFFHPSARDEWRVEAMKVMLDTAHQYQVLTKRPEEIAPFLKRTGVDVPGNMWIGATVERADCVHRIATLRAVPARIRFLSIEPLIGPVGELDLTGIHWVILGGESGIGARPMDPAWAREVRDQCIAQDVPLFFKQWGKATNNPLLAAAPSSSMANRLRWVSQNDPNGKGGSKLDGREWKEYPS